MEKVNLYSFLKNGEISGLRLLMPLDEFKEKLKSENVIPSYYGFFANCFYAKYHYFEILFKDFLIQVVKIYYFSDYDYYLENEDKSFLINTNLSYSTFIIYLNALEIEWRFVHIYTKNLCLQTEGGVIVEYSFEFNEEELAGLYKSAITL